ncbi:69 kDa paraflagellar rod protein [Diplonema papillatum]|nr:69 kDa paraflagellar rod protein [Diplonema papillatum]
MRPLSEFDRAKNACMDVEEDLVQLLEPYQKSRDAWRAVSEKLNTAKEAMADVEKCIGYLAAGGGSDAAAGGEASRLAECRQQVRADDGGRGCDLGELVDRLERAQRVAQMQQQQPPPKAAAAAAHGFPPRAYLAESLGRLAANAAECHRLFQASSPGSHPGDAGPCLLVPSLSGPLLPVARLLERIADEESRGDGEAEAGRCSHAALGPRYRRVDEAVGRLAFDAAEAKERQLPLSLEGRVEEAQQAYRDILAREEAGCRAVRDKFADLDRQQRLLAEDRAEVTDATARANAEYKRLQDDTHDACLACQADLTSLRRAAGERQAKYEEQLEGLRREQHRSEDVLRDNAKQQADTWARLTACQRDLNRLARERYTEVQKRIGLLEEAERHRLRHADFTAWVGDRTKALNRLSDGCHSVHSVLRHLHTLVASHREVFDHYFGSLSCALDSVRDHTHRAQFLPLFKGMYLTAGDLHAKKQHSLKQIQAELDREEMKLAVCQESLDPKAKTHAQRVKQLRDSADELTAAVSEMEGRQQLYLEWFEPTETALCLQITDASHPVAALQQEDSRRKAKLAAYQDFIGTEHPSKQPQVKALDYRQPPQGERVGDGGGETCDSIAADARDAATVRSEFDALSDIHERAEPEASRYDDACPQSAQQYLSRCSEQPPATSRPDKHERKHPDRRHDGPEPDAAPCAGARHQPPHQNRRGEQPRSHSGRPHAYLQERAPPLKPYPPVRAPPAAPAREPYSKAIFANAAAT